MDEFLLRYINYLKSKNMSKNTLDAYKRDIDRFLKFILLIKSYISLSKKFSSLERLHKQKNTLMGVFYILYI